MAIDILVVAVVIVNALFALGVVLRNREAGENLFYAAFVGFLDLWIISNFLENEPNIVGISRLGLFLRLDFAFAILALYAWLLFCGMFTRNRAALSVARRAIYWIEGGCALLFAGLSFAGPLIIKNISFSGTVIGFEAGPLWMWYAIFLLFFAIFGLWHLFRGRQRAGKEARYLERQQIDIILIGFFLSVGNAIFINLFLQAFYPITLTLSRIGIAGLVLLVVFVGYAITRSRLFDLRFAIMRTISFVLLLVVFAVLYAIIFFIAADIFTGGGLNISIFIILLVTTVAAALSFQPIEKIFRRMTSKLFFQEQYDAEGLMAKLTQVMAETIDLKLLTNRVLTVLLDNMRITKGAFLLVKDHHITDIEGIGYAKEDLRMEELEHLFHENRTLAEGKDGSVATPLYFLVEELDADSETKKLLLKYDISLAVPIRALNEEVAILIVGPRRSGERYYAREIETLLVFSAEAGIAIQNAESYEAIKKFNEELEQTVALRTAELKTTQEQELAKANDVARLKDEFVFLAAHELRAPAAAIKGFVELVAESNVNLPEKVRHYLDSIARTSNNLNQIINDLLEIARSDAGTMKVETVSVQVTPIIEDVLKECEPFAKRQNISLRYKAGPPAPSVSADSEKVREVLVNLVTNAIKYNRPGGFVEAEAKEDGTNLLMAVRDNGYGIPKEDQGKIFEKFFRSQAAAAQAVPGTGLGLFISRMLVERMGGTITFTSTEEGSTFLFSLPIEHAAK